MQTSRGIAGSSKTEKFLPAEQLDRIITQDAVFEELNRDDNLNPIHDFEDVDLRSLAREICCDTDVRRPDGKIVIRSFRKIFATLVFANKVLAIPQFLEENVSDLDLPLVAVENYPYPGWNDPRRKDDIETPLNCFREWHLADRDKFESYQWRMLAPYFTHNEDYGVQHYDLIEGHILPYISGDPGDEKTASKPIDGGFGTVYMVRIHPEHHNFHQLGMCDSAFAIKQLKQQDETNREAFEREVKALRKFSGAVEHEHVVSLLATYQQFGKFHLIFHRAEAHLLEFWRRRSPAGGWNDVLWMASQCEGLADGLMHLHNWGSGRARTLPNGSHKPGLRHHHSVLSTGDGHFRHRRLLIMGGPESESSDEPQVKAPDHRRWSFGMSREGVPKQVCLHSTASEEWSCGPEIESDFDKRKNFGRHGDIKPHNILWYCNRDGDMGTLKLADFGQAELNSQWSKSKEREVAYSRTYRAPECDIWPRFVRQNYDIWSLACVYLEFVAWMVGGNNLVTCFANKRLTRDAYCLTDPFFDTIPIPNMEDSTARVKPAVTEVSPVPRGC